MKPTFPILVHHKPFMGVILLCCGLFIGGVGIMIGTIIQLIMGGMFTLMGIMYFTKPALYINEHTMELKNLLGMTIKTYPLSPDSLELRDRSIYISGKKVRISRVMLKNEDVEKMEAYLQQIVERKFEN